MIDFTYNVGIIKLNLVSHRENQKSVFIIILSYQTAVSVIPTAWKGQVFSMKKKVGVVGYGGMGQWHVCSIQGTTYFNAIHFNESDVCEVVAIYDIDPEKNAKAREDGYVQTMFGRRRYLPELTASNKMLQAFGERVAKNMPVQGSAADIIKIAMIKVYASLKKENLKAKLIMQVHDELIVECPAREKTQVEALVRREMENACNMKVKLLSDVHSGKDWYEAKG